MKKIILILILALSANNIVTFAQRLSPLNFNIEVARGRTQELVINFTGVKKTGRELLSIYTTDILMNRSGDYAFPLTGGRNSASSWLVLPKDRLSLNYKKTIDYKFKVKIPFNAEPGEYYAVIMVEPDDVSKSITKNKIISLEKKSRIAVILLINVPGRIFAKRGGFPEPVKVENTKKNSRINVAFENTGRVLFKVSGTVNVRNTKGINFGSFPIVAQKNKDGKSAMLPGSILDMTGSLGRPLPSGDYIASVDIDYGYKYKKARKRVAFKIKRKAPLKEDNAEYIYLDTKEYKLQIPERGRRSQIIKISNQDYRPLKIVFKSPDGVKVAPGEVLLQPGKTWNVKVMVTVDKYDKTNKKIFIIKAVPERGKTSEIKIITSKNNSTKK